MTTNAQAVMEMLNAIERRDQQTILSRFHPEIAFHWPPGLPYGGDHTGADVQKMMLLFGQVWEPLRHDEESRRMDSSIVAADVRVVVASYDWGGRKPDGSEFHTRTMGRYEVEEGLVRDAHMFHYDLVSLIRFIAPRSIER